MSDDTSRRRRRRPLRRFRRLLWPSTHIGRVQRIVVMLALLAMAGLFTALAALRSASGPPATTAEAPALLPSLSSQPTPFPGSRSVPVTVRLLVPAAAIDLPVIEGDGVHVPLHRAMHYPGTSEPGAGSNAVFYAHAQPGMFLGLYHVRVGDLVRAVRADGTEVVFTITDMHRVPWDDLDITRPTATAQIVLLTCTSYNPHDPRFIVTATPV